MYVLPVQTTGEEAVIKATQSLEALGTRRGDVIQKNARSVLMTLPNQARKGPAVKPFTEDLK